MDLPRTSSQTSICPQLLTDLTKSQQRTPASKRLLSATQQQQQQQDKNPSTNNNQTTTTGVVVVPPTNNEPQFAIIPPLPGFQPSRRREEARVLQNLRKRIQAVRVLQANKPEPIEVLQSTSSANNNICPDDIDNRPHLLQKILTNRPVSMILDLSDLRTAWQDSDFITDCLCWHNVYRQRHGSPQLSMNSELCYLAQTWANHLAHTNRFYYRNDKDIGQNLFCRPSNGLVSDVSGQEVTSYWYSAVRQYNFGKEHDVLHCNVNAGHFTQLVWLNSRYFGVGKARSRSGKIVVVAHYAPPGNISGHYMENVLPPCAELVAQQQLLPLPPPPPPRRFQSSGGGSTMSGSSTTS